MSGAFQEVLESRRLMSATSVFNPTVTADRLEVKADLLAFKSDALASRAALLTDITAANADGLKSDPTLLTPIAKLRTDLQAQGQALKADRLTERSNAIADELVIVKELRQATTHDRKNATALAADKVVLTADRVKLQTDLLAGLDSRIATRQANVTTLFNDAAAITAALATDTTASPALSADVTKLVADRTARLSKLTSDLQTIATARAKLATDLTASLT